MPSLWRPTPVLARRSTMRWPTGTSCVARLLQLPMRRALTNPLTSSTLCWVWTPWSPPLTRRHSLCRAGWIGFVEHAALLFLAHSVWSSTTSRCLSTALEWLDIVRHVPQHRGRPRGQRLVHLLGLSIVVITFVIFVAGTYLAGWMNGWWVGPKLHDAAPTWESRSHPGPSEREVGRERHPLAEEWGALRADQAVHRSHSTGHSWPWGQTSGSSTSNPWGEILVQGPAAERPGPKADGTHPADRTPERPFRGGQERDWPCEGGDPQPCPQPLCHLQAAVYRSEGACLALQRPVLPAEQEPGDRNARLWGLCEFLHHSVPLQHEHQNLHGK